jgi:hypothetical protein
MNDLIKHIESLDKPPKLAIIYMGDSPDLMRTGEFMILQDGKPLGLVERFKLELDCEKQLADMDIQVYEPEQSDE